jgi:hypothetical protein
MGVHKSSSLGKAVGWVIDELAIALMSDGKGRR